MVSQLFILGVVWGSVAVVAGSTVLAWRQRPRPGATAFAVTMLAATWWVTTSALGLFTTDEALSVFWGKVEWAGIAYLPVAWLAFALAYTGRSEYASRGTVAALAALPTVTLGLVVTNGVFHDLVFAGDPEFHPAGAMLLVERSFGPWFWVHVAYSYLLLGVGTALVVQMVAERRFLYRGQALALVLVVAAPWTGHAVYLAGLSPVPFFDATPYTLVISGAAGIAALTQLEFLDAVPVTNRVARRSVVENVDAGVLVADTDGRVLDANPRAAALLRGGTESPVGDRVEEWLPALASEGGVTAGSGEEEPGSVDTVVEVSGTGSRTRFLEVTLTELTDDYGNVTGRIVLLRDVTDRRNRLQRLNVLNRVLRHNLRNEMNVIYGHADQLARGETDPEAAADTIRDRAAELTDLADKAREIDQVLGEEAETSTDLGRVVDIESERVVDRHPAVDLETTVPDARLPVDAAVATALRNVIENAVEHNTAAEPWVEVAVRAGPGAVTVEVTDDGPGIPPGELAALDGDLETQLDHASGLGLWLAHWGVTAAGGTIDVSERDPTGTRVSVTVPRLDGPSEADDGPGGDVPESGTETEGTGSLAEERVVDDPLEDVLGDDPTGGSTGG